MRLITQIFIFVLFYLVGNRTILFSEPVKSSPVEHLKLVHADSLVIVSIKGRDVHELWGNVQLVQGEAFLSCEMAKWWQGEDRLLLLGMVTIYDGKRILKADRIYYDGKTRIEKAFGHVLLESKKRKLKARSLIYFQKKEKAFASGDVVISDLIEKVKLLGEKALYDRSMDYGVIEGCPRLVKIDTTSGKMMIVRGLKIEAWGKEQRAVVSDSVQITKGDMKAFCQKAEYRSEKDLLILKIEPIVWQQQREMRADNINIQLEGLKFSRAFLTGKAEIISKEDSVKNVLNGEKITVTASDDTVRRVVVEGQASSMYHIFDEVRHEQGTNSVTGDIIVLTFDENRLKEVKVKSSPGQCTGVYTPIEVSTGMVKGKSL